MSETTIEEIDSWDINKAKEMSKEIVERHGAKPYAFYFTTKRNNQELARSCNYFLGGKILTLDYIKSRNDEEDNILISNMKNNGWNRVIENCNSYRITLPLKDDDVILSID